MVLYRREEVHFLGLFAKRCLPDCYIGMTVIEECVQDDYCLSQFFGVTGTGGDFANLKVLKQSILHEAFAG